VNYFRNIGEWSVGQDDQSFLKLEQARDLTLTLTRTRTRTQTLTLTLTLIGNAEGTYPPPGMGLVLTLIGWKESDPFTGVADGVGYAKGLTSVTGADIDGDGRPPPFPSLASPPTCQPSAPSPLRISPCPPHQGACQGGSRGGGRGGLDIL
jgi:hypothetical protein